MLALGIQLKADCTACGAAVPVNAFTDGVLCPFCSQVIAMDRTTWERVLLEPLGARCGDAEEPREISLLLQPRLHLTYCSQQPTCAACHRALADASLRDAGTQRCACGQDFLVRQAPPALVELGLDWLIGEEPAHVSSGLNEALRPPPEVLRCPGCGANLSPDGRQRSFSCPYCSAGVVIPDAIWQRLQGAVQARGWYATLQTSLQEGEDNQPHEFYDFAFDVNGDLYVAGRWVLPGEWPPRMMDGIARLDRRFRVKWRQLRVDLVSHGSDSPWRPLAFDASGNLLVKGRKTTSRYAVSDGAFLGSLDPKEARSLDELFKYDRAKLSSRRSADGREYIYQDFPSPWPNRVSCTGAYELVRLPADNPLSVTILGSDRRGRLYLRVDRRPAGRHLLRLSADGLRADCFPVEGDDLPLQVSPTGVLLLCSYQKGHQVLRLIELDNLDEGEAGSKPSA